MLSTRDKQFWDLILGIEQPVLAAFHNVLGLCIRGARHWHILERDFLERGAGRKVDRD